MIATWTGMTAGHGADVLRHSGHRPAARRRPPVPRAAAEAAFMQADEYDPLIDDPTGFLYSVWLPRVAARHPRPGHPVTWEHNLSLVKGAMAMMQFFGDLGHAGKPPARGMRHGLGHRRHVPGAAGPHRRQAARLPGTGRGSARPPGEGPARRARR